MPRTSEVFTRKLNEYLTRMRNKGLTERYINEVENTVKRCMEILEDHGRLVAPQSVTQNDLALIRECIPFGKNGTQLNKQRHLTLFQSFLKKCGNANTEALQWPEHVPNRPSISPEDFAKVTMECYDNMDIRGATVLLLLSLSARRVAVLRSRPEDIGQDSIILRDKGRGGGKLRRIPLSPEDRDQLQQYLNWRQSQIQRVLSNNPKAKIPDRLIIWARQNAMGNVGKTAIDKLIKNCGRRAGVTLTSHMPRRMTSRELYYACKETGEPIDTAMEITGHKDKNIFMQYVGAIDDNKRLLMDKVREHRTLLFTQMRGKAELASK